MTVVCDSQAVTKIETHSMAERCACKESIIISGQWAWNCSQEMQVAEDQGASSDCWFVAFMWLVIVPLHSV